MADLPALLAACACSVVLTGLVRRGALSRSLLDLPNARSSHTTPTPRGGGLGLVIAAVSALVVAAGRPVDPPLLLALAGVLLVSGVGWLDDQRSLGVRARLLAHLFAAATLLPLALSPSPVPPWLGVFAGVWWVFWSVSAINVVNFMDGIDGLIGSQALIFGAYLALLGDSGGTARELGLVLSGAATGFLAWNWPPAKIFLGDVGSGALGLLFVLGGLLILREGRISLVVAYLPLYPVFLDATATLARRAIRGERVTEAHRTHLYQRLANGGWGHARVTLLYGGLALAAVPIAILMGRLQTYAIAAYFLLVPATGLALELRSRAASRAT